MQLLTAINRKQPQATGHQPRFHTLRCFFSIKRLNSVQKHRPRARFPYVKVLFFCFCGFVSVMFSAPAQAAKRKEGGRGIGHHTLSCWWMCLSLSSAFTLLLAYLPGILFSGTPAVSGFLLVFSVLSALSCRERLAQSWVSWGHLKLPAGSLHGWFINPKPLQSQKSPTASRGLTNCWVSFWEMWNFRSKFQSQWHLIP